jgi:hypothetical protein
MVEFTSQGKTLLKSAYHSQQDATCVRNNNHSNSHTMGMRNGCLVQYNKNFTLVLQNNLCWRSLFSFMCLICREHAHQVFQS